MKNIPVLGYVFILFFCKIERVGVKAFALVFQQLIKDVFPALSRPRISEWIHAVAV